MAVQLDGGGKEDLKTQFVTREGTYKLMTLSEYSRPNRVGYTNSQGSASVRVSFVTLPDPADPTGAQGLGDRMCFNFGKELYVYVYRGVKKVSHNPATTAMVTRDASEVYPSRRRCDLTSQMSRETSIFADWLGFASSSATTNAMSRVSSGSTRGRIVAAFFSPPFFPLFLTCQRKS